MAKGFDKVNHSMLLLKLMKRNIPTAVIKLLHYWYSISLNCVRWENTLSMPYKLLAGVRQGGVTSPTLFSVYVDDMLKSLKKFGCYFKGLSLSAIMYADDLMLISSSVTELQSMLRHCSKELSLIDLQINSKKSCALRIGPRFKTKCVALTVQNDPIEWSQEAKYLGIYITSGPNFKCNFMSVKPRAANAILAKLGQNNNKPVTLSLISAIALPILLYSIEALSLNKSELIALNHPWLKAFEKLFVTFDKNVIKQCHVYNGYMSIKYYYGIRSMSFLHKMKESNNTIVKHIYACTFNEDLHRLSAMFNCKPAIFTKQYYECIHENFLLNDM